MNTLSLFHLILSVASFNAIFFFCLFHKWNRKLKDKLCVFCAFGWTAIAQGAVAVLLLFFLQGLTCLQLLPVLASITPIWGISILIYTFTLMAFEFR